MRGRVLRIAGFSPLREGDTSVATRDRQPYAMSIYCFSPLREGDTSVD